MELMPLLALMVEKHGSDLFLSVGAAPCLKVDGFTRHLGDRALTTDDVRGIADSVMSEAQRREFEARWEMNLSLAPAGLGRFRINLYRQRGEPAMAVRYITEKIPTLEELNLPPILRDIVMMERGLVLLVGASGSGKSTSLAAMVDYRNGNRTGHILTIEEPIEYLHQHNLSIVDQREVGFDTHSFADALVNAMREAPDVIMIGEIRDRETMQAAIAYADTGHLCLATLHASNASQTLDRIVNFFPDSARPQLLLDLSLNLKAVVGQRLVKGRRIKRIPAVEVLLLTPYVADLIAKGEVAAIRDAMKRGSEAGMKTFDQALYELYMRGEIRFDVAMAHADSKTDLALQIRLHGAPPGADEDDDHGLALEDPDTDHSNPVRDPTDLR